MHASPQSSLRNARDASYLLKPVFTERNEESDAEAYSNLSYRSSTDFPVLRFTPFLQKEAIGLQRIWREVRMMTIY